MLNPEEIIIYQEELRQMVEDAHDRIEQLINLTFHRKELYDAWYEHTINSSTITMIAAAQQITPYHAKKRIKTAQEIVIELRKNLHKLDDLRQ
jgi:hypothetical protein